MPREISLPEFTAAHAEGALVIDVREPFEYLTGHVPGALPVPSPSSPAASASCRRADRSR